MRIFQNWKLLNLTPWNKKIFKPIVSGLFAIFIVLLIKPYLMPFHTIITIVFGAFIIFTSYFLFLFLLGLDDDDRELKNTLLNRVNNLKLINN